MSASPAFQWPAPVSVAPDRMVQIQSQFMHDWLDLAANARDGTLASPADRRFSAPAWSSSVGSLLIAHSYLIFCRALERMVDAAEVSAPVRRRLRFSVNQWLDAVAPSNFLVTNPDAQELLIATRGQSLVSGMRNFLQDVQKGRLSQTDESEFQVGVNVAITPGAVVFENRYMQVLQYAPQTPSVYKRPLLIVPPCINKFYILDLRPENSFVRHAVEQGFTVFLVSWRNPMPGDTDGIDTAQWSDYLKDGVLKAVKVVQDISRQEQINALGFCVGGTMLASALALAQAKGTRPVAALTLVATFLDFADTGTIDVFVSELQVRARERRLSAGGLMSARELATTFSFLRPNELVWNYVVNNYLKGREPAAFDLLYWNADGTNLPGPFFVWYLRNTYLENNLKSPGRVMIDDNPIDLTCLDMPAYVFGSREDHIVPWQSAYGSVRILSGPLRFVLGASGHIAGVVNPPEKNRRSYWTSEVADASGRLPSDAQAWLQQAAEHQGSWWPDWVDWLAAQSGPRVRSKQRLGNARHPVIEAAPGRYVAVRAI